MLATGAPLANRHQIACRRTGGDGLVKGEGPNILPIMVDFHGKDAVNAG